MTRAAWRAGLNAERRRRGTEPANDGNKTGNDSVRWATPECYIAARAGHNARMRDPRPDKHAIESAAPPPLSGLSLYVPSERPLAPAKPRPRVCSPEEVYALCAGLVKRRTEEVHVLLLNPLNEVVRRVMLVRGELNVCNLTPANVFGVALRSRASSILLVHNHPSGHPEPSANDIAFTRRLGKLAEMLGLPLLDHVIVARRGYVSLRQRGVLS